MIETEELGSNERHTVVLGHQRGGQANSKPLSAAEPGGQVWVFWVHKLLTNANDV